MTVGANRKLKTLLALVALAAVGALFVVLAVAKPTLAQTERSNREPRLAKPGTGNPGSLSAAQKQAISGQGYLVPDQGAYDKTKAKAANKAAQQSSSESLSEASASNAPTTFRSWRGIQDTSSGPSDSTGAIGPRRYIELVNSKFAIYNRTDDTPLSKGTLNALTGESSLNSVFDPQVIWDATTKRFYYAADDVVSATDNRLAFGFSTTASPSSAADWCKYTIQFGSDFPDYPKLGDSSGLLLLGTNTFSASNTFLGSDLYSVTKPPAGTTGCPDISSFTVDSRLSLTNSDGTGAFTPVPTNQIDTSGSGWVVAIPQSLPASYLSLYQVTSNTDGTMNVSPASNVTVPTYDVPNNAPQPNTTNRLDTLDARNTQAVSATDPSRGTSGATAIWTQHTIFGGSGAVVRWYEINPATASLFQRGTIAGGSGRYIFNGAISPDRKFTSTATKFGGSMVLGFNSSSSTQRPDIRTVSKIGANPVSSQVLIKSSPASLNDFTCSSGVCRWGDYAAASPDPATPLTASHGRVWFANQWVANSGSNFAAGWGSWNWAARP